MTDEATLRNVLDGYQPVSFAERQMIGGAREYLRDGTDPVDILGELERQRGTVDEWTALEQNKGIDAVLKRHGRELVEWWDVQSRRDPAEKREWIVAHPILAPLGRFSDAAQAGAEMAR